MTLLSVFFLSVCSTHVYKKSGSKILPQNQLHKLQNPEGSIFLGPIRPRIRSSLRSGINFIVVVIGACCTVFLPFSKSAVRSKSATFGVPFGPRQFTFIDFGKHEEVWQISQNGRRAFISIATKISQLYLRPILRCFKVLLMCLWIYWRTKE